MGRARPGDRVGWANFAGAASQPGSPGLPGATGAAALVTDFVQVVSGTAIGSENTSLIGGPLNVNVANLGESLAIIASAQISGGLNIAPSVVNGRLVVDAVATPNQPTIQLPKPIALGFDGEMLEIVWDTGPLSNGVHSIDFQANSSGPQSPIALNGWMLVLPSGISTGSATGATGPAGPTGPAGGPPGPTGPTGPAFALQFGAFPVESVSPPLGVFTSIIGGAQSFTLPAPAQVLIVASGLAANNTGSASVAAFQITVDGMTVQQQILQLPKALGIVDGETFSFVFVTVTLPAGLHMLDLQMETGVSSGISSVANSGALFFQVQ